MSWRLGIRHRTHYRYRNPVRSSYNEARITPLSTPTQVVEESRVEVSPSTPTFRYWDYWGTLVDAFDVQDSHDELVVVGDSVVETSKPLEPPDMGWDRLSSPEVADRFGEFLAPSRYVHGSDETRDVARTLVAEGTPAQAVPAAISWVSDRLDFHRGATHVHSTAADALALGSGVCQDFAHLTLALLRAMGVPARYTSGYIHPSAEAEIGAVRSGQSHAWVEVWTGDWHPFDPTHRGPVGNRHVVVARGRDYADVSPLRGIYRGGPLDTMEVEVEVTRLA